MGWPRAGRTGSWLLALTGAVALLAAIEASTAPGSGGLRASRDEVRLLLCAPLLFAALLSFRVGARAEGVGFLVAVASLVAAAACDAFGMRWIGSGADAPARLRRHALLHLISPLASLAAPGAVGAWALRIRLAHVFDARRPTPVAMGLAAALGVLLFPLLNASSVYGNAAVRELMSSGSGTTTGMWPRFGAVFQREFFPLAIDTRFVLVAARLGIFFPLLEACLHGVLRQAFLQWGSLPFVVGTAFLAPLISMDGQMTFGLFFGMVATGIFAARTASVLPGLAFWYAVFFGQILWLQL